MELWITTQDNECLMKIDRLDYDYASSEHRIVANGFQTLIGKYKSRERALEILKEISNRITNKYIVKPKCLIKPSDMMKEKEYLDNTYDGDFIMQPSAYEIEPINPNVVYYEMPKE